MLQTAATPYTPANSRHCFVARSWPYDSKPTCLLNTSRKTCPKLKSRPPLQRTVLATAAATRLWLDGSKLTCSLNTYRITCPILQPWHTLLRTVLTTAAASRSPDCINLTCILHSLYRRRPRRSPPSPRNIGSQRKAGAGVAGDSVILACSEALLGDDIPQSRASAGPALPLTAAPPCAPVLPRRCSASRSHLVSCVLPRSPAHLHGPGQGRALLLPQVLIIDVF